MPGQDLRGLTSAQERFTPQKQESAWVKPQNIIQLYWGLCLYVVMYAVMYVFRIGSSRSLEFPGSYFANWAQNMHLKEVCASPSIDNETTRGPCWMFLFGWNRSHHNMCMSIAALAAIYIYIYIYIYAYMYIYIYITCMLHYMMYIYIYIYI